MKLFDSHAHLDSQNLFERVSTLLTEAKQNSVEFVLSACTGDSVESINKTVNIAKIYPDVFGSAGIHPHSASIFNSDIAKLIYTTVVSCKKIVAIGEIGLDFYYNFSPKEVQISTLEQQLTLAQNLNVPVIIHQRLAHKEMIKTLKKFNLKGVIHCFSGNKDEVGEYLDLGFYISFSGIVTFKKAYEVQEAAKFVPLERMLVETDSPYLTPTPYRGKVKVNEPKYLIYTVDFLANLKGLKIEEVAYHTTRNTFTLFNLYQGDQAEL